MSKKPIATIAVLLAIALSFTACTKKETASTTTVTTAENTTATSEGASTVIEPVATRLPDYHDKIIRGDFSEFAGTWKNGDGDTMTLRADGTFSDVEGEAVYFSLNEIGYYSWSVIQEFEGGAFNHRFGLFPAGVDAWGYNWSTSEVENVQTDKTKVRLLHLGVQEPPSVEQVPNSIFYFVSNGATANPDSGFTVVPNDTGVTITAYTGTAKNVVIPETIGGVKVTEIGGILGYDPVGEWEYWIGAFASKELTSVTFPDSVIFIGGLFPHGGSFTENQLTSVTIPNSVTIIAEYAFTHNPLNSITIGENVKLGLIYEPYQPSFPNGFDDFYNANGKQAGTYTFSNGAWSLSAKA